MEINKECLEILEKMNKYTFGSIAIFSLTLIQLGAWLLGFDGHVTLFVTGMITLLIGFVVGKKTSNQKNNAEKPQTSNVK